MKKTNTILSCLLIFSIYSCAPQKVDDNSTPEALAETLLYILKTEDQELFDKHLLTAEDDVYSDTLGVYRNQFWYTNTMNQYREYKSNIDNYEYSYRNIGKEEWLASKHPDQILASKKEEAEIRRKNILVNVFRLKEGFRQQGLTDWSKVEFDRFTFRFIRDGNVTNSNSLYFTNGEYTGEITMPAFVKAKDGTWRFHNPPEFDGYFKM